MNSRDSTNRRQCRVLGTVRRTHSRLLAEHEHLAKTGGSLLELSSWIMAVAIFDNLKLPATRRRAWPKAKTSPVLRLGDCQRWRVSRAKAKTNRAKPEGFATFLGTP